MNIKIQKNAEAWELIRPTASNTIFLPYILLWIFSLIDYATTHYLIGISDFFVEANPIMQLLLQITHSVWSILILKISLITLLGVGLYKMRNELKTRYKPLVWAVTIVQASIALYGTGLTLWVTYG